MSTHINTIAAVLALGLIVPSPGEFPAYAERLSRSNSAESTVQPQCDLCWTPSTSDRASDRLPTFTPHRQRRPPDSRPHRLPKGRYKLNPDRKHGRLSSLRNVLARRARMLRSQQVAAIDGDTIRYGAQRIRLQGIDTPELNEPGGQAAKERLEELLHGGPVQIVPHGMDVYGRTVADVFVNGQNVTEILIREGYSKSSG
jgi:endonuclease YncB( thermonuclease family)